MATTTWTQTAGMVSDEDVDNLESYAEQALASKNAAAESETNAATSETNAATSATNASVSASSAATSAANAATSATNASTSETNASTSATSASTSATAASTSATAAAASETAAAASETAAAASETAAAASETAAASSETAAASSASTASTAATTATTKASEASTSATNAATSETNAATSETNAATSETNAATSETNAATSATNAASSATAAASSASSASTSASAASSAQTAAESARDATLAAYDNFDDRYLGAKSSAPSVDNDGNALVAGALYFDSTAGAMKVYTGSAWVAAYVSGTDYLPFSGGTMTGDVGHGDGVKATFGASADLQLFHDSASSSNHIRVDDATQSLQIRGGSEVIVGYGTEKGVRVIKDGAVQIRYDDSTKLETSSSGIDVTGTVVSDGLTVDGDAKVDGFAIDGKADASTTYLRFQENASSFGFNGTYIEYDGSANELIFGRHDVSDTNTANDKAVMSFQRTTGDISFYEDTGTTAKFFWDASAEALGIGTNTPNYPLDVETADATIRINSTSGNSFLLQNVGDTTSSNIIYFGDADSTTVGSIVYRHNGDSMAFSTAGSEAMRILSSGTVGIGTSSPSRKLTVEGGSGDNLPVRIIGGSGTTKSQIEFQDPTTTADYKVTLGSVGDNLVLQAGGTEAVRITSSGNLQMTAGGAIDFGDWTITESGGSLYFATGGTNKMKLDASGNLDVVGSVNSNATIT